MAQPNPSTVIVGMATTTERRESAQEALKTLAESAMACDAKRPFKRWLWSLWVNDESSDEVPDLADCGKFTGLGFHAAQHPFYYLSCDDDFLYPLDYMERTLAGIDRHRCVVAHHGRVLRGEDLDYYSGHQTHHCLKAQPRQVELDVAGSGVAGWRTDDWCPADLHNGPRFMADLALSRAAAREGVRLLLLPHEQGWLRYIEQPPGSTIAERMKGDEALIRWANEIYRLRRAARKEKGRRNDDHG